MKPEQRSFLKCALLCATLCSGLLQADVTTEMKFYRGPYSPPVSKGFSCDTTYTLYVWGHGGTSNDCEDVKDETRTKMLSGYDQMTKECKEKKGNFKVVTPPELKKDCRKDNPAWRPTTSSLSSVARSYALAFSPAYHIYGALATTYHFGMYADLKCQCESGKQEEAKPHAKPRDVNADKPGNH